MSAATATRAAIPPRVRIVSVLTAGWLAVQLFSGLKMTNGTWPVPGFPMFRLDKEHHVEPGLVAVSSSNERVEVTNLDFGLTRDQLANYLNNYVVSPEGEARDGAAERLARLATIWERERGGSIVSLEVVHEVFPFPAGSPSTTTVVLTWREP